MTSRYSQAQTALAPSTSPSPGRERSGSRPTTTTAARRSVRPSTVHSPTPSLAPGARWSQTDLRRCTSTSAPGRWSTPARSLPFTSRVMRSSSANPADSLSRPTEASSPSPDIPFLIPARYAPRCPRERADEHVGNDLDESHLDLSHGHLSKSRGQVL